MENYQPTDQTPFSFTGGQEDWGTFFDISDASQPGYPAYGQGMFGGVVDVVESPDYAGYAPDMQGPQTSFESHAPGMLTQCHPMESRFQFSVLGFRCHQPGCTKLFKRKDHLVQHLRHLHQFSDAEVHEEFPIQHKVVRLTKPVCPFSSCPDHRGDDFKNQSNDFQELNKPFAKQSDYTKHMKNDHDWSPYPCAIPSCDKKGKNGYFRPGNLQKHRDEQHPEAELLEQ
ncbi:hypothetical protein PG993_000241 [Apiospora rasikravindrae]|uniref:C2H2-type domain-containing protein n=1 Tax=Apiospora rasikravindrae TaxID=990691 RepID=A0ABR1U808_9PEZI